MRTGEAEIYPIVPLESWRMRYDGVARRVLMADLAAGPLTDGPTERVKVDLIGTATTPAFGKGVRAQDGGCTTTTSRSAAPASTSSRACM